MATRLYETLEVTVSANTEEIRKAYKKKALQTHPDRLAQGATEEDKTRAEEQFRLVNHAYEVLIDPEKRRLYDLHGVYPPPAVVEEPRPSYAASGSWGQPRYRSSPDSRYGGGAHPRFAFTDPFEMFNLFFNDLRGDSFFDDDPFGNDPFFSSPSGFHRDPFSRAAPRRSPFDSLSMLPSMFSPSFGRFPGPSGMQSSSSFQGSFFGGSNNGQCVSDSYRSITTSEGTQTIHERTDASGNKHVTKTYPDGRKSYRINGVKQPPPGGHIPGGEREHRQISYDASRYDADVPHRYTTPPPSYSASDEQRLRDRQHHRTHKSKNNRSPSSSSSSDTSHHRQSGVQPSAMPDQQRHRHRHRY